MIINDDNNGNENNNNTATTKIVKPPLRVLNTPKRKATVYSFALYYIVLSSIVGAPLPFPSLIDVSAEHVAFINFLSLLVTLVGSIIGIGFYVERRNNLKFDQQNIKMDRIDQKIDKRTDMVQQQLREMEGRICRNFDEKLSGLERNTEFKVQRAKDIEDERFKRIDEAHREHERRLDNLDRDSYEYYNNNRRRGNTNN